MKKILVLIVAFLPFVGCYSEEIAPNLGKYLGIRLDATEEEVLAFFEARNLEAERSEDSDFLDVTIASLTHNEDGENIIDIAVYLFDGKILGMRFYKKDDWFMQYLLENTAIGEPNIHVIKDTEFFDWTYDNMFYRYWREADGSVSYHIQNKTVLAEYYKHEAKVVEERGYY